MTKFLTLNKTKKTVNETVFKWYIGKETGLEMQKCYASPKAFDNVLWLGHDPYFGDVFKAWNDHSKEFTIYFGEKGDEFDC